MLTRRSFLQLVGASVAVSTLRPVNRLMAMMNDDFYYGRALAALSVYEKPSTNISPAGRLWPDSITPILDQNDEWYQIPAGWARRDGIQPMLPYDPRTYTFNQAVPFWAEVAAPVAAVRAYCAADAPLVARVGHGGVLQVIDVLPGEPNGWYGVAYEQGRLIGWTQGVFWRPITLGDQHRDGQMICFNCRDHLMSAYEGEQLVLEAPFSSKTGLNTGTFTAGRGSISEPSSTGYHGMPWQIVLGKGQSIAGVYWHNQFGRAVDVGTAIQLTPLIARWVYEWLGEDAHVLVE